ncbi:hypothetical protein R50073_32530 [Maricurvus nonylphenolicus]|uniref:TetR/AcrR family transcriptional regulator n=1 Tax=Maricurvus nonylphenolicus TaxID=1008307 RepID=UPI0036F24E34
MVAEELTENELPPSKPIPTQARARLKRDALIAAATEDFKHLGYESTTAKSIANRAEVATGTFYQYFHNKDDMLRVIARERLEQLSQQFEEQESRLPLTDITALLKHNLALVFTFHEEAPELHQVLEQRRHCDPHLQEILKQGEVILSQQVLDFVKTFNVEDPEAVAFSLFAMSEGLAHHHLSQVIQGIAPPSEPIITLGAEMLASYFKEQTRK